MITVNTTNNFDAAGGICTPGGDTLPSELTLSTENLSQSSRLRPQPRGHSALHPAAGPSKTNAMSES